MAHRRGVTTCLAAHAVLGQSSVVPFRRAVACALALGAAGCTSGVTASPAKTTPVAAGTHAPILVGYLSSLGVRDPRLIVAVGQRFQAVANWRGAGEGWQDARFSAPIATHGRSCLQRISVSSGRTATAEFVALRTCRVVLYATAMGLPGPVVHPAMFLYVVVRR